MVFGIYLTIVTSQHVIISPLFRARGSLLPPFVLPTGFPNVLLDIQLICITPIIPRGRIWIRPIWIWPRLIRVWVWHIRIRIGYLRHGNFSITNCAFWHTWPIYSSTFRANPTLFHISSITKSFNLLKNGTTSNPCLSTKTKCIPT